MPTFPQLSTGAIAQYPYQTDIRFRTVRHEGPNGGAIAFADVSHEERSWDLTLEELSSEEWAALEQLFVDVGGSLRGFTFLDPSSNLLAWSEDLEQDAWANAGAGLTAGQGDPLGGNRATTLTAGGGGATVSQTIDAPGDYRYAASVWARTSSAGAGLRVANGQGSEQFTAFAADGVWRRYKAPYDGGSASESMRFEIQAPGSGGIDVFGPQLEAQAAASEYKPSGELGGVYPWARFDQDVLSDRSTGPQRHSARLRIIWTRLPA